MDDLHQNSHAQTGLPTEYFALCSEHFEASCFSRSVLIGTPVDFKRFYLEKSSVPSIHQYTRSRKIHWTLITQEIREDLQIDFFPRNVSIQNSPPLPPPPPPSKKEIDFFSDWVGLLEICFRSSEVTDPRPCPRGWAYFRVPSCSTETCQAQTNNKLSAAKIDIFRGQRNITGRNTPSQQTSLSRD